MSILLLWIVLSVIVLLVIVAIIAIAKYGGEHRDAGANYKSKQLLTENEKEFFNRLRRALPEYEVFPQVAMGAVLAPNVDRSDRRRYYQIRGTFSQKIIDFLICDKTLNVVAAVELDDRTHNAKRDEMRDAMLMSAGYRVLRWHSKNKPSEAEIRAMVMSTGKDAAVLRLPQP